MERSRDGIERVLDDPKYDGKYRVYAPDGSGEYIGEAVDCKEMMKLHGYTIDPPPQKTMEAMMATVTSDPNKVDAGRAQRRSG